jgi:hypothetical protein
VPRLICSLLLLLLALGGGCATTGSDRPVSRGPECAGLDAFTELARSAGHIIDVMHKHPGDPDAAAAELDAYATERDPVTRCLRGMLPALDDRMDDDPQVLSDYARKVGPVVQRTAQAQKDMPEMFEHDGMRRAIQRLH